MYADNSTVFVFVHYITLLVHIVPLSIKFHLIYDSVIADIQ